MNSIDRGWQQMSMLLDKEMPRIHRRRRIAIWWFVATGVALVLSGWGYHFWQIRQDKSNSELPQLKQAKVEVATSPQIESRSVSGDISSVAEEITPAESDHVAVVSNKGIASQQMAQKSTDESSSHQGAIRNTSSKEERNAGGTTTITANHLIDPKQQNAIGADPVSVTTEEMISSEQNIQETATIAQIETSSTDRTPLRGEINIARIQSMAPGNLDDARDYFPMQISLSKHNHGFGLEALAATHLNSDGNPLYGIEAGLSTVLRADKRLRVHAGVTYGYYNVDGISILGLEKNADAELLANQGYPDPSTGYVYDVEDVLANNLQFSEAKQLTEKFHYLHVPVSLEYRISPRLSASAGCKLSTLVSAPARYRLNDARFNATQAQLPDSRSFLYNYDILRKVDIAPVMSISFMLAQHLWFDVSYIHGLVHYINSSEGSERNDFHRSASMGLRYRIL